MYLSKTWIFEGWCLLPFVAVVHFYFLLYWHIQQLQLKCESSTSQIFFSETWNCALLEKFRSNSSLLHINQKCLFKWSQFSCKYILWKFFCLLNVYVSVCNSLSVIQFLFCSDPSYSRIIVLSNMLPLYIK